MFPLNVVFDCMQSVQKLMDEDLKEDFCFNDVESFLWPVVQVKDQEGEILVIAEIPGVKKEHLNLELLGNELTLSGVRATAPQVLFKQQEGDYKFERKIRLPSEVDTKSIKATHQDGILEVRIEKKKEAKGTKIKID